VTKAEHAHSTDLTIKSDTVVITRPYVENTPTAG